MTDVTSTELAIPYTGELISAGDIQACLKALDEIRWRDSIHRDFKAVLTRLIADEASRLGVRTIELEDGRKAQVSGGWETQYDAEAIQQGLADAGMPAARIAEIVEETISLKVKAVEAKRAANANAAYATVIDDHSREVDKPVTVSIRRT